MSTLHRRAVLAAGLAAVLAGCTPRPNPATGPTPDPAPAGEPPFAALEKQFGGRLGVAALDTGSGATTGYRAGERFLMCSTVKALLVAAVLQRSSADPALLDRRIRYTRADLIAHSPVTASRLADGMTVAELCEAALTVSDNAAENLLSAQFGGPAAVTAFLRALGDPLTSSDRTEPALNDSALGDLRDTTTPSWFVRDLQRVALGTAPLTEGQRGRLTGWMTACTTGAAQIRAGVPAGWQVADKTGSGSAGESNDVGIVRPPGRAPIVLAIFTAPASKDDTTGNPTIAAATRIALGALKTP
ncbi:class A beta-lactamase [Amycolatopsis acidiphila]|uniref:Beta-lactamase n=1 Tax=Amycolatopsis acidiphila TaxID=715473 RepID=A0A558A8C9_9PSEU|nr:class A beta-lactamase [Amycolatopsis acidiphila]TVT20520.1 class A beta-lactamase [Amycolatopsis acidiphila]UIJ57045.1 class A beta-lactamase [Amycolatopsis acidiphila]GHG53677.1 beta-lactamase [Amycolatopsis acidiphila]